MTEMPRVEIGDIVLFSSTRGGEPMPGIVLAVSDRSVDLALVHPSSLMARFGVRHDTDPRGGDQYMDGYWRLRPETVEYRKLLSQMGQSPAPKK